VPAVRAAHAGLAPGDETDVTHRVAGRLAARRGQGKMAFLDLVDRSGRIQLQARVDELGAEGMERLLGLEFEGTYFDVGTVSGFLKTSIAYALDRPGLRDELLAYLRTLDGLGQP